MQGDRESTVAHVGDGTLSCSGTVMAIARINEEMIKVTNRDANNGSLYDFQFPFSQIDTQRELPFNVDDKITIQVRKL